MNHLTRPSAPSSANIRHNLQRSDHIALLFIKWRVEVERAVRRIVLMKLSGNKIALLVVIYQKVVYSRCLADLLPS